jgi:hypothetical protein
MTIEPLTIWDGGDDSSAGPWIVACRTDELDQVGLAEYFFPNQLDALEAAVNYARSLPKGTHRPYVLAVWVDGPGRDDYLSIWPGE